MNEVITFKSTIKGESRITKEITLDQFYILNDVLYEIEESKDYEGEDKEVLEELKDMFSYTKYTKFRELVEND